MIFKNQKEYQDFIDANQIHEGETGLSLSNIHEPSFKQLAEYLPWI